MIRDPSARALLVASTFAAASLVAPPSVAQPQSPTGDGEAEVDLRPDPPFDKWCVVPFCPSSPVQHPSRLRLPAVLEPDSSQGYLEQSVKREISDAITGEVKSLLGANDNEAFQDVAEAVVATATADSDRLRKAKGLGAAVVRGALTYEMDRVVPGDPACAGARRYDALYEGLALSVALFPLEFPQKKGHVSAACVDTAKRAERAVDEAVISTLFTDDLRRDVATLLREIQDARRTCASVQTQAQKDLLDGRATIAQAQAALRALRAETVPAPMPTPAPPVPPGPTADAGDPATVPPPSPPSTPPSPIADACTQALAVLRDVDPARLDALAQELAADATLADVALVLTAPPPDPTMALIVRLAAGGFAEADMRARATSLATSLVQSAGIDTGAPVFRDAMDALGQAVVVREGMPTLDPGPIAEAVASHFGEGPFLFEMNGGVPSVDFSQGKLIADLTLGYRTKTIGFAARGWVDTYDIDTATLHNDYTHAGGSLEAWWLSGDRLDKLRYEVRFAGAVDYYDTTTYPFVNPLNGFYDFDSRFGRGSLLVGLRYGTSVDRVSAQILVGGGAQYEDPDTTQFTGSKTLSFDSQGNLSVQGSARVLAHFRVVPAFFGVRASLTSTYFSITREDLTVDVTSGRISSAVTVNQDRQIEVHGRLFLDADVASVNGFVPALWGGVDYLSIQGNSASLTDVSSAIPVLGVGIVRQAW